MLWWVWQQSCLNCPLETRFCWIITLKITVTHDSACMVWLKSMTVTIKRAKRDPEGRALLSINHLHSRTEKYNQRRGEWMNWTALLWRVGDGWSGAMLWLPTCRRINPSQLWMLHTTKGTAKASEPFSSPPTSLLPWQLTTPSATTSSHFPPGPENSQISVWMTRSIWNLSFDVLLKNHQYYKHQSSETFKPMDVLKLIYSLYI